MSGTVFALADVDELRAALGLPSGFMPSMLACSWCGDKDDRLDVTSERVTMVRGSLRTERPPWRDWLRRHKHCEERSKKIEIQVVS